MEKITTKSEKEIIAKKILSIQKALNLNGMEMARLCDVSNTTIYRLSGTAASQAGITERLLLKICERTGADEAWLLDMEASPDEVVFKETRRRLENAAERVRLVRKSLGMTQKEFADLIGISKEYMYLMEAGKGKLSQQIAQKIEKTCDHAGAEWLLTGEERNRDYPVGEDMIEWLRDHPEKRKVIWEWMAHGGDKGGAL